MAPKSKAPEQASEISSIGKAWLVIYNLLCIFGWLYIDSIFYTHYQDTGHFYGSSLWSRLDAPLKIVQTAALLEVFHAIFKLVKANPVMAFIQVSSRLAVLWLVISVSKASQKSPALLLCTFAWAMVEVPRYSYYLVKLIGEPLYIHTWIRYSLFIVLYPAGIAGEIGNILYFFPEAKSISMSQGPGNFFNIAYSHQVLLALLLLLYIPGSPTMISHMWRERNKQLSPKEKSS